MTFERHPIVVTRLAIIAAMAIHCTGFAVAAEIKLLSSPGARPALTELAARFEGETGNRLVIDYDVFTALKKRIDANEAFDVAILSPALVDELVREKKIAPESRTPLGRYGLGLAVRKGSPRPDIATAEALRRVLLQARSIAYSKDGASGKAFLTMLDRLRIAPEVTAKSKAVDVTTQAVAEGAAQYGVTGVGLILADPAVDLVGRIPSDLQSYVVYTLGASTAAKESGIALALIRFLASPLAGPVLSRHGVEPGLQ